MYKKTYMNMWVILGILKLAQRMLDIVGSNYKIQAVDKKNWLNLSQE